MYLTKLLLPRGIIRSTYSSSSRSWVTSSRASRSWIQPSGMPASAVASLITEYSRRLEFRASLPPFISTALPDFRQREAICGRASGLDSKTTPITPIGEDTR